MLHYRIAGVDFTFRVSDKWRIEESIFCRSFAMPLSVPEIVIELKEQSHPLKERGQLIYTDDSQHIRLEGDTVLRYVGNYALSLREIEAVYCQEYHRGQKGFYTTTFGVTDGCFSEQFLLGSAGLEHILADYGRVILHSSFLAYKGSAVLFSAPSGTGKSTQAELWRQNRPDTEIINGDRSVLSCDNGQVMAHGIPFCGTSGISLNKSLPVRAIVVLRQSGKNEIQRLGEKEAFALLFSECGVNRWSKEDTERVTELLCQVVARVPVFYYACRPDKTAVDVLEAAMDDTE